MISGAELSLDLAVGYALGLLALKLTSFVRMKNKGGKSQTKSIFNHLAGALLPVVFISFVGPVVMSYTPGDSALGNMGGIFFALLQVVSRLQALTDELIDEFQSVYSSSK